MVTPPTPVDNSRGTKVTRTKKKAKKRHYYLGPTVPVSDTRVSELFAALKQAYLHSPQGFRFSFQQLLEKFHAHNPHITKAGVKKLVKTVIDAEFPVIRPQKQKKKPDLVIPVDVLEKISAARNELLAERLGCSVERLESVKKQKKDVPRLKLSDWTRLTREYYREGLRDVQAVRNAVSEFNRPPRHSGNGRSKGLKRKNRQQKPTS